MTPVENNSGLTLVQSDEDEFNNLFKLLEMYQVNEISFHPYLLNEDLKLL